ncbi:hypothetical protein FB45DRAFT_1043355 [Roridomyces roridus]|uniref:Uncharacterized protein n=1 Tax=Roridomyces roridus TaxID=1738132 RepID=A0AAD7AYP9_9AGAR|nr:hypothetical protein FB45DRAFT_1043355 [Roridomyces roridus]
MRCRAEETVAARRELEDTLRSEFGRSLPRPAGRTEAEVCMRELIFDWDTVVAMAWFVHRVIRSWNWFGRRLPTMVCELAPDSDVEGVWDFNTATEDESEDEGWEMDIDF